MLITLLPYYYGSIAVCISVQMLITLLPYYYNGSVTVCISV